MIMNQPFKVLRHNNYYFTVDFSQKENEVSVWTSPGVLTLSLYQSSSLSII